MAPNVGLGTQEEGIGWPLYIVSVVGVLLSALFVFARLGQRYYKSKLGLDDYMIIASLISSGLLSMCECQAVVYGYGREWKNLSPDNRIQARKWFYGAQIMYKTVIMTNKLAVVCLYYRLFAIASRGFRMACHIMNGFIAIGGMAFIIGTVFQCQPLSAFWNVDNPDKKCFKEAPWWISYSVIQIVTDGFLLALPVKQVWSLKMTKMEKVGLFVVFATGGFVTFASIFRATTVAASAGSTDLTYGQIPSIVWSVVEANAGIICACLPMLRHPFLRMLGPLMRTKTGTSGQRSYQLTSRSNYPTGLSGKSKSFDAGMVDCGRDSEDRIMGGDGSGDLRGGRGSRNGITGITVRKDVIITRNDNHEDEEKGGLGQLQISDRSVAGSVNDDDDSSKSGFQHV